MDNKIVPKQHEKEMNEKQIKQELENFQKHQEQVLTLQRMREIEAEIEENDEKKVMDMVKVEHIPLNKNVGIQDAYLAELQDEQGNLSYELYNQTKYLGASNEQGLIILDDQYIAEMNQRLERYEELFHDQYLIKQDQALVPEEIKDQGIYAKNELENMPEIAKECDEKEQEAKEKQENEDAIQKMEDDLGMHIVSLVRIEDENFSEDVIGRQTGYTEQYVALTDSGTFYLIGEDHNGKYELNPDFVGATTATANEQPEYNENGECCGKSYTDMVMRRSDGTTSNLALNLNYGEISLYNRDTNEEIVTATTRPSAEEIEEAKEADQKGRTIAEQEKYVDRMAERVNKGEESAERLEKERQELERAKKEQEEEEDRYYESWVESQRRKGYM